MWILVYYILNIFLVCLLARIVLSWFPPSRGGTLDNIRRVLDRITEPVLAPIRAILPPVRMGGMALDLSPLIVFFVLQILLTILPR